MTALVDAKRAAVPAVLLALTLARLSIGDPSELRVPMPEPRGHPHGREPEVSPSARMVLGDLTVGDRIAGFEVARIGGPANGEIVVELRAGRRGARVWIARRGTRGLAARQTEHFDLLYGHPPPDLEPATSEQTLAALDAVVARIEAAGARPPGDM